MNKLRLLTILAFSLSLVFTSCSVEKRRYNKGYNVDWNSKAPKATEKTAKASPVENQQPESVANTTANNGVVPAQKKDKPSKETAAKKQTGATANKNEDTQSVSVGYETTPGNSVKPYDFKVKEGADLAKKQAKPFFAITMLQKAAEGNDILAILAFIFGILALFSYYASFLLALFAIIFGAIAMGRTSGTMHLLALLGLIFGIIAIFLWAGLFVFVL